MKKKDWFIIITLIIFAMLTSSLVSVAATGNLFDSNEVVYDNTSSGMNSSNVKAAVDELYAAASDYSNINTRLTGVEGIVNSNSTSVIRNDGIEVGKNSSSYGWIDIYKAGNKRANMYINNNDEFQITSHPATAVDSTGVINVGASTVKFNNSTLLKNSPHTYLDGRRIVVGEGYTNSGGYVDFYYNNSQVGFLTSNTGNLILSAENGKTLNMYGKDVTLSANNGNVNISGNSVKVNNYEPVTIKQQASTYNKITNCNDATQVGTVYHIEGSGTNCPDAGWIFVWNIGLSENSAKNLLQFASVINTQTPKIWVRSSNMNGVFGTWYKVTLTT